MEIFIFATLHLFNFSSETIHDKNRSMVYYKKNWIKTCNSECIRVIDDKKVFTLKFHIDSRASYKLTISAGIRVAILPNNLNQQKPQSTKEMVDRSLHRRCYVDVSR